MKFGSKQSALMAAVASVCTGSVAQAADIPITVDVSNFEVQRRSDDGRYFSSMAQLGTGHRIGFQTNFGNRGAGPFTHAHPGINGIYFFKIPSIAAGTEVLSARLDFSALRDTAATGVTPTFNADLYALGFETAEPASVIGTAPGATAGVETAYAAPLQWSGGFQSGNVGKGMPIAKIQDNILTPADHLHNAGATTNAPKSTSATGSQNLGDFVQSLYTTPGFTPDDDQLMLRVNPDVDVYQGAVNQRYQISTLQTNGAAYPGFVTPTLTLSTVRSSQWVKDDSTSVWSNATSWSHGAPAAAGEIANFGAAISTAQTVNVDGTQTVGTIRFNNANSYTLSGGAIVLDTPAVTNRVVVTAGSHSIGSSLTMNKNTTFDVAGGSTLTASDLQPAAAGASIAKSGAGTLTVNKIVADGLSVGAGSVEVSTNGGAGSTTQVKSLAIADGAKLNLNDNDLIVNHDGSVTEEQIRQHVRNGRAASPTTGIFSTPGATTDDVVLAVADNAEWGKAAFNGIAIDATTIVGKYTYFGDANLDGAVTGDDYLAVDAGLGTGNSWIEGDFNMSTTVTGDDYLAVDANLGKGTPNPLAFAELKAEMVALHAAMFGEEYLVKLAEVEANGFETVPEPGALSLIGLGAFGLLGRRRPRA